VAVFLSVRLSLCDVSILSGRLSGQSIEASLSGHLRREEWKRACQSASNLSELSLTLGDARRLV
jgi:hypothetical protein